MGCFGGQDVLAELFKYENPDWLRDIVATKVRRRRCLGALIGEIEEFMGQLNIRAVHFEKDIPEVVPGSEIVTEIIRKEYHNITDQEEEDEVEIKGQRSSDSSGSSSRNYQLTIDCGNAKFKVGGANGLSTSFFNIGSEGVGFTSGDEPTGNLGKEYSIVGKIRIPAKTKLAVTIISYSCTYKLSDLQVLVSARPSIRLKAHLDSAWCAKRNYCYVTAEDFLRHLCDPDTVRITEDKKVIGTTTAQLSFLGEETKVKKEVI